MALKRGRKKPTADLSYLPDRQQVLHDTFAELRIRKPAVKKPFTKKAIVCDGQRWDSLTEFAQNTGYNVRSVRRWLYGERNMPKEWHDKHLRFEDKANQAIIPLCQKRTPKTKVEYDGKVYESYAELARHLGLTRNAVAKWFSVKLPEAYKDKGVRKVE